MCLVSQTGHVLFRDSTFPISAFTRTLCQVGVGVSDSAVTQIKLRWVIHGLHRRH
jgi:hypothetical protein